MELAATIVGVIAVSVVVWMVSLRARQKPTLVRTVPSTHDDSQSLTRESARVVLGPPDSPFIEVTRSATLPCGTRVPASDALRQKIKVMLTHSPRLLAIGAEATQATHLVVRYSPAAMEQLAAGALEHVPSKSTEGAVRGMLRSVADKRIQQHADVLTEVNWAAVGVAAWQIAAVITAQKYLAEINARLADIQERLDALIRMQTNEHWGAFARTSNTSRPGTATSRAQLSVSRSGTVCSCT
jgi:hypothetical protein